VKWASGLAAAALLLLGGCSWMPARDAEASLRSLALVEGGPAPADATKTPPSASRPSLAESGSADTVGRGAACAGAQEGLRVRDLTRPWSRRLYLLPDGRLCSPRRAR